MSAPVLTAETRLSQPLYDIWQKMDLQWYARPVGETEWHVFVHRPVGIPAFPIKPVVGAEVGQLSAAEAAARVVALAEQPPPGQTLEVTGGTSAVVDGIRRALGEAHGERYRCDEAPREPGRPVLRSAAPTAPDAAGTR